MLGASDLILSPFFSFNISFIPNLNYALFDISFSCEINATCNCTPNREPAVSWSTNLVYESKCKWIKHCSLATGVKDNSIFIMFQTFSIVPRCSWTGRLGSNLTVSQQSISGFIYHEFTTTPLSDSSFYLLFDFLQKLFTWYYWHVADLIIL